MARTYQFIVGAGEAGVRLDRYVARHLPSTVSRVMIQRSVREGNVTVGDRSVKAHYKVRAGDVVSACFTRLPARARDLDMAAQDLPLEIVYEDAHLLVVNKPAGMVTHPAPGHWDATLVNAILWHFNNAQGSRLRARGRGTCPEPRAPSPEPTLARAGIVHRLDKDTSGLLLVAKTQEAHAALSKQLKARTIRRRYLALVEGHLPLETGTVNIPIGRHLIHRKEMTVRHLGGRAAVSHYRVLTRVHASHEKPHAARSPGQSAPPRQRAPALAGGGVSPHAERGDQRSHGFARGAPPFPYTVIEVSLETGRTHQIRVHMAHLGYPVVGDPTYGKHPASFWHSRGISRQLLHAYRLSFQHPTTHRPVTLTAPVPEDMAPWIANLPLA